VLRLLQVKRSISLPERINHRLLPDVRF
jgi:hypothetical protein